MNPAEMYQFLITLIRDGAEVLAAAIIALVVGVILGFRGRGWWSKEKEQIDKAQEETRKFQAKWTEEKDAVSQVRNEYTLAMEEKNKAIGKLKGDLDEQTGLLKKYQQAFPLAQKKLGQLTSAAEKAKQDAASAQQAEARAKEANVTLTARCDQAMKERDQSLRGQRLLEDEVSNLQAQLEAAKEISRDLEQKLDQQIAEREQTEQESVRHRRWYQKKCKEMRELQDRIQAMIGQGGRVWERELPDDAPEFIALGKRRRCPIISLLNLKGGVGKTTLALNLAATLADRGNRVLMIDCDHQRSLTSLCIQQKTRDELHLARRTLQHFLLGPDRLPQTLLAAAYSPAEMKTCSLVINSVAKTDAESDGLANVEDRLMLEWLSPQQGAFDIRFALRAALHSDELARHFDYVLIDCPPRLSTATINALVASDDVIIPVVLDATSATIPLPHLMQELGRLHKPDLFPQFRVLGVVANRVQYVAGRMVGNQNAVWNALPTVVAATHSWHEPIHRFTTMLPLSVVYSKAAKAISRDNEHAVAVWTDEGVREAYNELTTEILQRIADEAPHLAVVSS